LIDDIFRYVDNIFVIWRYDKDELHKFFIFLNNQHINIHFIIEENGKLPFLDVLVSKKTDLRSSSTENQYTQIDIYVPSTTNQHKNSLQSIHLYIELSPSLIKNIYR